MLPPQPPLIGAEGFTPLVGGAFGAAVWRAVLDGAVVVVKRTTDAERTALRLLDDLPVEPGVVIPPLLRSGVDEIGHWVVVPYYDGQVVGLLGQPPVTVVEALGRVHATFRGRLLPAGLERLDEAFVVHALVAFAGGAWRRAAPLLPPQVRRTAVSLTAEVLSDAAFLRTGSVLPSTLLHGDVHGGNVLLPSGTSAVPVLLDWGSARVGPAMFDVAMFDVAVAAPPGQRGTSRSRRGLGTGGGVRARPDGAAARPCLGPGTHRPRLRAGGGCERRPGCRRGTERCGGTRGRRHAHDRGRRGCVAGIRAAAVNDVGSARGGRRARRVARDLACRHPAALDH